MRGTFGQSAMGQSSDCVCIVRTLARRHKFNRSCLVPGQPSFSAPQPNSISQISPREVTRAGSRQMVAQPPFGFTDPQGSALHSSTRFSVGLVSMKGASSNFDRPSCPTRTTETVVLKLDDCGKALPRAGEQKSSSRDFPQTRSHL